ncbi:putative wall-associated receptor kinase-like 16 [Juglans microcarpa x Juglans regia]|uniref:putative wall-associated receptor kinase-like 16 n=1 Tax=Juglans microcarpa x Juglans regia TaxID=2249226 RepID=UPI001B7E4589|nr:putative wall-associated receptor kinase-like 16 [Juglans microcarpa x Juglans regia]
MVAASAAQAKPGCDNWCGGVEIPYPFGLSEGCSLGKTMFNISCDEDDAIIGVKARVTNISIEAHEMHVQTLEARDCYHESGSLEIDNSTRFLAGQFAISTTKNQFTVLGCDTKGIISGTKKGKTYSTVCISRCNDLSDAVNGSCSGIGCCNVEFPDGLKNYNLSVSSFKNHTNVWDFNPCGYAFVVQKGNFSFSTDYLRRQQNPQRRPVVLDWAIGNETCEEARRKPDFACHEADQKSKCHDPEARPGYQCKCKPGYQGNPYLRNGCQDIDECNHPTIKHNCSREKGCINTEGSYKCRCPKWYQGDGTKDAEGCAANFVLIIQIAIGAGVGFICMLVFTSWMYFVYKKRKIMKLREKFFQQNGGLILEQRLGRQEGSTETLKIFTVEQLQKATKNYDESRIIGRGGFGTVYKGFLPDNKIVAIKKSKIEDENQIEQFINEVVVLSQTNHRHVVKLLGCCLETQVPLLVYEFVSNGTLFKHIHQESNASTFPWETRLRIAAETAEALWYLHSAASIPIIHRDVKSTNILLDDDFNAKVSDFGTSRLIPRDQTQLATVVQGTLGYLDPEYLQTNQLTDKSDVYSFGVVLVELLTGKEALSFARTEEQRSLAMYFISSMKEERLFEILENHIVAEGNKEQIQQFVELATSCLAVKGEERPTMREVAMELEGIRKMQKHPWVWVNLEANPEEVEHLPW